MDSKRSAVEKLLREQNVFSESTIKSECEWFFEKLGIHSRYFEVTDAPAVASHVAALIGAKVASADLSISQEDSDHAMFAVASGDGVDKEGFEERIERQFLSMGTNEWYAENKAFEGRKFRLQSYRTRGTISPESNTRLRFYFLQKVNFANSAPADGETNLAQLGDTACLSYLDNALPGTSIVYQRVVAQAAAQLQPVIEIVEVPGSPWEMRMVIAFKNTATHSFFSAMKHIWHNVGLRSLHKYVEHFSNGVCLLSVYLEPVKPAADPTDKDAITEFRSSVENLKALVAFHFILPRTNVSELFDRRLLNAPEVAYAYVALKFAYLFLTRYSDEYWAIDSILSKSNNNEHTALLASLKSQMRASIYTEDQIRQTLLRNPRAIKMLFDHFAASHFTPGTATITSTPKKHNATQVTESDVRQFFKDHVAEEADRTILETVLKFNRNVLKTNFFKSEKSALSFRLSPNFLNKKERPVLPFGVFFLVGSDFIGFHMRFADIARGGIRIIRSATHDVYTKNQSTVFDENYSLAMTQQNKNKDIPEGGSKGTILLSLNAPAERAFIAFQKYIDSILDLLLPHPEVSDHYGKPEILFLGPDEGTADFMAWAAQHAHRRGASFWKAFTTGKPPSMGGIPHDLFGMTTKGVHEYVVNILRDFGLDETQVFKLQTGGPDGDLGSNEIKISKDKTVGIVDGSGVLFDPHGINREELLRLATKRRMIDEFDTAKLSADGMRVLLKDNNIRTPSGEIVANGTVFRNNFHLYPWIKAQLFVPCGGRPGAVNATNVQQLINEKDGTPRFRFIVEGANLFFTQEARLVLERHGVVLIKDASANKGGVTSSSLEVLVSLALSDDEFNNWMCVRDINNMPAFYKSYVQDILDIITENSRLEYGLIMREHRRRNPHLYAPKGSANTPPLTSMSTSLSLQELAGIQGDAARKDPISFAAPISVVDNEIDYNAFVTGSFSRISDDLSFEINNLNDEIGRSALWDDENIRRKVISTACPKTLLAHVAVDEILKRVPLSYLKSIFGSFLAARFIYKYGLKYSPMHWYEFLNEMQSK